MNISVKSLEFIITLHTMMMSDIFFQVSLATKCGFPIKLLFCDMANSIFWYHKITAIKNQSQSSMRDT